MPDHLTNAKDQPKIINFSFNTELTAFKDYMKSNLMLYLVNLFNYLKTTNLFMKNLFLLTLGLVLSLGLRAQTPAQATPATEKTGGPKMVFETNTVDYGEIKKGADPLRKAVFTNKGTEPLIVKNARGSCGCTVPTWPKEPIMPGETGVIEIRYDTQRVGSINKTVSIQTNEGDEEIRLFVKGNISEDHEENVPANQGNVLNPKG
ncbi:MAG TPA: DUF1573 domain-containing protein [Saprospiraceae bacterium]|nr:DUF1573 domain-containing protein [Saprospiraceae bacterium]HMX86954.1 DUF1573 domain-containing protein [Saprospiraceae bacterium]HMZ39867.1 DUF1573 domain-containing protein [Saprospiraceae bacterium]HNA65567.1 DUF1573 domain-containing protein [Saprospiraceae bacterium]HNB32166.1 DUF1573 domain-containing protein [Saprospiraceae bacterium]